MRIITTTTVLSMALTLTAVQAATINLITNGDFESGTSAGWVASSGPAFGNTAGSCNDTFAVQSTGAGCKTGLNPMSGSYAAYSSSSFPTLTNDVGEWDNYFRQSIVVPTGITSAILSWSDTTTWSSNGTFTGLNLLTALVQGSTYLSGGSQYGVVNPGPSGSQAWTTHTLDVTSLLQSLPGQTIQVQLASFIFFDTRGGTGASGTAAITGWDNVQLNVTTPGAATPEPATLGLTGAALTAVFFARRRRRSQR